MARPRGRFARESSKAIGSRSICRQPPASTDRVLLLFLTRRFNGTESNCKETRGRRYTPHPGSAKLRTRRSGPAGAEVRKGERASAKGAGRTEQISDRQGEGASPDLRPAHGEARAAVQDGRGAFRFRGVAHQYWRLRHCPRAPGKAAEAAAEGGLRSLRAGRSQLPDRTRRGSAQDARRGDPGEPGPALSGEERFRLPESG